MRKITIDPVTRVEGHLKVEVVLDDGQVKEARLAGTLFRGLEAILVGRHPLDACRITQRICGVCPTAHATASSLALDEALGVAGEIPDNGRLIRNLMLGSNTLQSHILHFYHLVLLDYLDVTAVADYDGDDADLRSLASFIGRGALGPFVPRLEGGYRLSPEDNRKLAKHYVEALAARRLTHEMLAVFGGKMPHNTGIVPGGVAGTPNADTVTAFLGKLKQLTDFVEMRYLPDAALIAKHYADHFDIGVGCDRFVCYGMFDDNAVSGPPAMRDRFFPSGVLANGEVKPLDVDSITESVAHSWYDDACAGKPSQGTTQPAPAKEAGYSWIKSPRYDGKVHEVGPMARARVALKLGHTQYQSALDALLGAAGAGSDSLRGAMGRNIARAAEAKVVMDAMMQWLVAIEPGKPQCAPFDIPEESIGLGLTGAPRGALLHFISIKDSKIARYQAVVPTTWNASPRDDADQPGPVEQALTGIKVADGDNPFEVLRVVRSFDPCLACAVHLVDVRGRERGVYRIA